MTKTFLIIDNQAWCHKPEQMTRAFADVGIDAEFEAISDSDFALEIISEWKAKGLKLDVLTCDLATMDDNVGIFIIEGLLERVEKELGADMLPQKLFFHSASPVHPVDTKYGKIEVLNDADIFLLSNQQGVYHEHLRPTRILAEYLNQNWSTKFVTSKAEEKKLENPESPLDANDVSSLLYDHKINPEEGLRRIRLDETHYFIGSIWIDKPSNYDAEPCELRFSSGVEGTLTGVIAFTADEVAQLKTKNSRETVILVLKNAAGFEIPPAGVDALIVLEDDVHAMHIRQVCQNMGIPALVSAEQKYGQAWTLEAEDFLFTHHRKASGPLKSGAGVTIKAYNSSGVLYAGRFPLENFDNNRSADFADLLLVADTALAKEGVQIKANADTPDQIANAIKKGAHGIGLVRTEHMFFQPEKRAMLREYLLSPAPSEGLITSFREAQETDFRAILESAATADRAFPVTIRLLDAPPDEFMDVAEVGIFKTRVGNENTRGVQAGLRTQGLYEAQIAALCSAFQSVNFAHPLNILVPNVLSEDEMDQVRALFNQHAAGSGIPLVPMMENRVYTRALMKTKELIPYASVSFGTNDLTSDFMGGIARNNAPAIISWMNGHDVHGKNPFLSLMPPVKSIISEFSYRTTMSSAITICGQQVCDDLDSIRWAARERLSLSVPFRYVPYAKLVAGQEILLDK